MKKKRTYIILSIIIFLIATVVVVGYKYVFPHPIDISANDDMAAVLMSDGTVRAKGINNDGDCNVVNLKGISSFIIDFRGVTALTKQGIIYDFINDYDYPSSKVAKLFAVDSPYYNICQTKDGKTYYYDFDEMTYIPELDSIEDIIITDAAYGLKKDGTIVKVALEDTDDIYSMYDFDYAPLEKWNDIVAIEKFGYYIACLRKDGSVFAYSPDNSETFEIIDKNVKQFCILEHHGSSLLLFAFLMEDGTVEQVNLESEGAKYLDLSEFKDIEKIAINNLGLYGITNKGKIVETEIFNYKNTLRIKHVDDIKSLSAYRNVVFAIKDDGTAELAIDRITRGITLEEIKDPRNYDEQIAVLSALKHTNIKDIKYYNIWDILVLENDGTVTPYDGYYYDKNIYFDLIKEIKAIKLFTNNENKATALITNENKILPIDDYFHFDDDMTNEIMSWDNVVDLISDGFNKYALLSDSSVLTTDSNFSSKTGLLDVVSYSDRDFTNHDFFLTDTNNLFEKSLFKSKHIAEEILEIALAGDGLIALRIDGTVIGFGSCEGKVEHWKDVAHVYDCDSYACALTADGEILTTIYDGSWED